MGIFLSFVFGFIPMFLFAALIYWLDRFEKEPKLLLGVAFFWGAIVAAGAAFVFNTGLGIGVYMFTQSEYATELTTSSLIAPIIEEVLKGLAVLMVFLVFRNEFDSVLDGIVYAGITALGFAATENTYYIYNYGYLENGMSGLFSLVFIRVILVGWQHPFYTAFTGIGLAWARLSRTALFKLLAVGGGLFLAIMTHGLHNLLASLFTGPAGRIVGTLLDWSGWFLMFLFILYMIYREQTMIARYLQEEINLGNITTQQYRTAASPFGQTLAWLSSLINGSFRPTSRFYQVCGEIAHKKRQRETLGEEDGNSAAIDKLRSELKSLSSRATA